MFRRLFQIKYKNKNDQEKEKKFVKEVNDKVLQVKQDSEDKKDKSILILFAKERSRSSSSC